MRNIWKSWDYVNGHIEIVECGIDDEDENIKKNKQPQWKTSELLKFYDKAFFESQI